MAYRASTGDLGRGERWDRDRFMYERDRDRYGDERVRYEEDERSYSREPRGLPARFRDLSVSVDDRYDRRPPPGRSYDDDHVIRDRRYYHDDEPRFARDGRSPTSSEFDRRVVIEKERVRSPSPQRRRPNTLLRRQSSLDTFDRRPAHRYWEQQQEERYGPPARREDFRPPTNVPIPLPRTKALPPPRRFAERDSYDEIRVSDPDYYGDEEFRSYPERIREKEVIRERRRNRSRSRDSHHSSHHGGHHHHRGRSHHGTSVTTSTSRSSSTSSSSSSSSGGTTVKSEYPKKGKTRIPARLVSKRALIDLGWPFVEEGHTIVVQKALGQDNIDDLLKLSEDYKRSEMELVAARSHAGDIIEERRQEVFMVPPPQPALQAPPMQQQPPPHFMPVRNPPPPPNVEFVNQTTVIRDASPARSYTTSTSSYPSAVVVDARPREFSDEVPVGPLALVTADRDAHHHHHSHSRHRSHSRARVGKEIVTAERLSNGELVVFEERVEKIEEPKRGVRIEKDKKGRMSISVPKYR